MKQRLRGFRVGQRVQIAHPDHPLLGRNGTVVRLMKSSKTTAWVNMDHAFGEDLQSFPDGDPRANWIELWPQDCIAIIEKPAAMKTREHH